MADAGPSPDVHHQPPATTINIYYNYVHNSNNAASTVVMAASWYALD
jgi:hypothetical protein